MKNRLIMFLAGAAALLTGCEKEVDKSLWPAIPAVPEVMPNTGNYVFADGQISHEVLNNYLSRAITQAELLCTEAYHNDRNCYGREDDERMLLNVGAKFIGRAIYSWNKELYFINGVWLEDARQKIERLHAQDPDIIFQAAMFETVSRSVEQIPVPAWVFEAFGRQPENRNFRFDAIRNEQGRYLNWWGANTAVPDIQREEAQMWFYYMACRYMEIGIEAFHCGQVMLMASMGDAENGYAGWASVLGKIRQAARTRARRGTVLLDGHISGQDFSAEGKMFFDFFSFPLRLKEIIGEPCKAELKMGYLDSIIGVTPSGTTPSGWYAERYPYILEFDNFGVSDHPGSAALGDHYVWGYDEISWMYLQTPEYQSEFLQLSADYLRRYDPAGYVQMPGARIVRLEGGEFRQYRCNTRSEACPEGHSQEETIKRIWTR